MKQLFVLLILILMGNAQAFAYSSNGRNPPKKLSDRQVKVLKRFVPLFPKGVDPFEIVALAMVETGLTPTAIGQGNYGILQINCTIHERNLKKKFGFNNCRKDMLNIRKNLKASLHILKSFRKHYKQCRKQNAYSCYNGGQGWKVVTKRCLKSCEERVCRNCNRPARYQNSVIKHMKFLKDKYAALIARLYKPTAAVAR